MLPVYIINLDRRPDRWAFMAAQMDRLGIEAARISAIDVRVLAMEEEWNCDAEGSTTEYLLGATAGTYSHRKALQTFLDTSAPAALILEDDAELAGDTPSLLETVDWWPLGASVIRLETGTIAPTKSILLGPELAKTPSGRAVHHFERWAPGAAAFLINRQGAAFMLPHLDNPSMPIDHLFFDHRYSRAARELRALQIVPGAARQIEGGKMSDLAEYWRKQDGRKYDRSSIRRIPYKLRLLALRWMGRVKKRRQGVYYSPSSAV